MSCAKMAEPIKMPLIVFRTWVGPRKDVRWESHWTVHIRRQCSPFCQITLATCLNFVSPILSLKWKLDNSQIHQLTDCHLADYSQLADWTSHRVDTLQTSYVTV